MRTSTERAVLEAIDESETAALLRELIATPTANPPGNEAAAAAVIARVLAKDGLRSQTTEVLPLRSNLRATIGNDGGRHLLFNAHTDTMPAGSGWATDPFVPFTSGSRLYGRGAADVKGCLSSMIEALIAIHRAGVALPGRLTLDAVADEEASARGTKVAVEMIADVDWAIVAEPTELHVARASNGQVNFKVTFEGASAHGSTPDAGHNAIYDAAPFVALVEAENEHLRSAAHPLTGSATYNVGTIAGGVHTSIVPSTCVVTVDRRITPDQTPAMAIADFENLATRYRASRPGAVLRYENVIRIPSIEVPETSRLCRELASAIEDCDHDNKRPIWTGLSATSDAAILAAQGIETVVFGPGSIRDSAHRANEWIDLPDVHHATRILALTALRLLS